MNPKRTIRKGYTNSRKNHKSDVWLSTAATSSKSSDSSNSVTEVLPLDWTRMKRKRTDGSDESCRRRTYRSIFAMPSISATERVHHGHAIFCLHDTSNPDWFQGYFLSNQNQTPWGILAIQEEIDDCLACTGGGYRRLTLNFNISSKKKTIKAIDWTGGDMICLSNDNLEMETKRLLTGKEAIRYMKKYFVTLMKRLLDEEDDKNAEIFESLPNVAIILGRMSIVLPTREDDFTGDAKYDPSED